MGEGQATWGLAGPGNQTRRNPGTCQISIITIADKAAGASPQAISLDDVTRQVGDRVIRMVWKCRNGGWTSAAEGQAFSRPRSQGATEIQLL